MSTINEIKNTPMIHYLKSLGIQTVEKRNNEFWFKAPWRDERTASVKCKDGVFYDFGEGFGGNIFDFVMKLNACDFREALQLLSQQTLSFSFQQSEKYSNEKEEKRWSYIITKVQKLQNEILMSYLRNRGLNATLCYKYLVEVYYKVNEKRYFGIGFINDEKGIEIRNKYVKLCLGIKYYKWIKKGNKTLYVFESWSDFLSLLHVNPTLENSNDFLILNSLSMLSKVDGIFDAYSSVFLLLDNDEAGSNATIKCIEKHGSKMVDSRRYYADYKDLNDFLLFYRQS